MSECTPMTENVQERTLEEWKEDYLKLAKEFTDAKDEAFKLRKKMNVLKTGVFDLFMENTRQKIEIENRISREKILVEQEKDAWRVVDRKHEEIVKLTEQIKGP